MTSTTTHFIINYLVGKKSGISKLMLLSFVCGGIVPDLDIVALLGGWDLFFQTHRAWTHSPFVGVFLGVLFVALLYLFMKNRKINYLHAFAFFNFGLWLHLLWDFISIDKINILSPFGEFWVGVDILGGSLVISIAFDLVVALAFLAVYRLRFLEDFRNLKPNL